MRKEAKTLHAKAVDSIVLSVDHFNRAWDRGRAEAVLIMMDRAFELLLKAIIVHKGGSIRDAAREGQTIGFDHCLRKCLSDADLKCVTEDEAVAVQTLNGLRNAAQHHVVEVSEEQLYVYAQAGLTLFGRLCRDALGLPLQGDLPTRVMPICAKPPRDLPALFEAEFADIRRMVAPGSRKRLDAKARLRSMAILQASLDGKKSQPTDRELDKIVGRINAGEAWRAIFPGVGTLVIDPDADGPGLRIQITRNQGEAVHLVRDGDAGATVVAVRKINDLDYYSLYVTQIGERLGVSRPKLLNLIAVDRLKEDPEMFKLMKMGSQPHPRYSNKAVEHLRRRLTEVDLDELWAARAK